MPSWTNQNASSNGDKLLHDCESLTANGTWTAVAGGTNIALDTTVRKTGLASISFDVGATGGAIRNSTMTAVDLMNYSTEASQYLWVYLVTASLVNSIEFRWGSSLTDYYTATALSTEGAYGSLANGWNFMKFDWNTAATVGSPNAAAITSLHVAVATSGALANIRVDGIFSSVWFPAKQNTSSWSNQVETTPSTTRVFSGCYYGFGAFTLDQTVVSVGTPVVWTNQTETT